MRPLLASMAVMLCSCTVIKTDDILVAQMGGKGVLDYDGTTKKLSHVYSNEGSFKVAANAITAVAAASIASSLSKAKTASDNSVTASKNASDAVTAQKAIDAQAAKDAAAADLAGKKLFIDAGIAKPAP